MDTEACGNVWPADLCGLCVFGFGGVFSFALFLALLVNGRGKKVKLVCIFLVQLYNLAMKVFCFL